DQLMDRHDVGMRQLGVDLCLGIKASPMRHRPSRIRLQFLQGHFTPELMVVGAPDPAYAALEGLTQQCVALRPLDFRGDLECLRKFRGFEWLGAVGGVWCLVGRGRHGCNLHTGSWPESLRPTMAPQAPSFPG